MIRGITIRPRAGFGASLAGPMARPSHSIPRARPYNSTTRAGASSGARARATATMAILTGAALVTGIYIGQSQSPNDRSTLPLAEAGALTYADTATFQKAVTEMKQIVDFTESQPELDAASDLFFSTHRPPDPANHKPGIIVYPETTSHVSEIVKIAHKYRVPIVANSGMTSLEGHTMHTRGPNSVAISFARMDAVLAFHPLDLDMVVQPGVGWQEMDEFLQTTKEGKRLCFGPDPGMGATVGGMASTSASGTNAYKYGTMKENVVNLTVVLADGTILKTKQRPRKSSAGYDLTRLFIGLEGTLGLITEVTVKLSVKPVVEFVSVASFESIGAATAAAAEIVRSGVEVNALELLDGTMVGFVNLAEAPAGDEDGLDLNLGLNLDLNLGLASSENGLALSSGSRLLETATLLLKLGGPTPAAVATSTSLVKQISTAHNLLNFTSSHSEEENSLLWSARRNGLWSTIDHGTKVLADPNDVQVWTTDIAVPLSSLAEVISETHEDLEALGFKNRFATMGHIGDGNCHFLLVYNTPDYAKAQTVVDRMVKRALAYEGTCTGEHGVGVGKRKYLPMELGPNSVDLMRKLKFLMDPRGILNPDKVVKLGEGDELDEMLEGGVIKEVGGACTH